MRILMLILIFVFVLLQWQLWWGEGSVAHQKKLDYMILTKQAEIEAIEKYNEKMAIDLDELKKQGDLIAEQARSELGLIGKDETFYQIIKP